MLSASCFGNLCAWQWEAVHALHSIEKIQHWVLPVLPGLGSYGGMERLHYLLERVWERPDEELSVQFLKVGRRF